MTSLVLLPGAYQSWAYSVDDGGNTVAGVGVYFLAPYRAYRWTRTGGMMDLGIEGLAHGVSGDGRTVAGVTGTPAGARAFRWTVESGLLVLPAHANHTSVFGFGISADGRTVVGEAYLASETHGILWNEFTGLQDLGGFAPGGQTQLRAVSADGSIAAGWANVGTTDRAVRWTPQTGYAELGPLPGDLNSRAYGISHDGAVIVGHSWGGAQGQRGVRWVNGIIEDLGRIPNSSTYLWGVSGDGQTAVGTAVVGSTPRAVIWTRQSGMVVLNTYLPTVGVSVLGWTLQDAFDANFDGTVLVGNGIPNAWRAQLPVPPCYPNCDGSTQQPFLNAGDFTCFLIRFQQNNSYANCDNSTTPPVLNVADYTCFLTKFAAGCR